MHLRIQGAVRYPKPPRGSRWLRTGTSTSPPTYAYDSRLTSGWHGAEGTIRAPCPRPWSARKGLQHRGWCCLLPAHAIHTPFAASGAESGQHRVPYMDAPLAGGSFPFPCCTHLLRRLLLHLREELLEAQPHTSGHVHELLAALGHTLR